MKKQISRGDYFDGLFQGPGKKPVKKPGHKRQKIINLSPADLKDKVFEFYFNPQHIDPVCHSAKSAFTPWASLSQSKRNWFLKKLAQVYREKQEEIAILISRETGKPLWESRQEALALSSKIDVTLKHALPLVQTKTLPSRLRTDNVKEKLFYKPRGALLVLGPFNFPVHLANGHIVPALAVGNTVVFKPSDKTPASAQKLAECFHLAGFPKGVFNLIHGSSHIARSLVKHPLLDGVLFTGSYSVGKEIQKTLINYPQKICVLEMGGKNSCLVWKDANLKQAVAEVVKGAYITAGQRCSSLSRLILHKNIKKEFLDQFVKQSADLKIGHWKNNPFMGPLVDSKALSRFKKVHREAEITGAGILKKGKHLKSLGGYYVSPAIVEPKKFDPKSYYQNEELFLPFVTVYEVQEEAEAFNLINQSDYGLCFSVFTKSEAFFKRASQAVRAGIFNWNISTVGASPRLPFGGVGKSGNARPAGLFSIYNTVIPVGSLEHLTNH